MGKVESDTMINEHEPRYVPEEGFEDLEAFYSWLETKGKQVLGVVYKDLFDVEVGIVSRGEEEIVIDQTRLRLWFLLDDGGKMMEVSIDEEDITGLEIQKMKRGSWDLENWLMMMFDNPERPDGPFNKSSIPIKRLSSQDTIDDSVEGRIMKLNSQLGTPGLKNLNKERYGKMREELEYLLINEKSSSAIKMDNGSSHDDIPF